MKLNNLSRLTALLMAIMMLAMTGAVAEDSGIDIGDLTGGYLANTDAAVALIEAGYCSICAGELSQLSVTTWPAEGYICLHDHLSALTVEEAYQYLYTLYLDYDDYYVYQAYINAHANHVTQATGDSKRDAVICYDNSCTTNPLTAPGPKHMSDCLWYQATEYVYQYPVNISTDVSTPDALKNAIAQGTTIITLTFGVTGTGVTYVWQDSAAPDVADSWADIANATSSSYELEITPTSVGKAYRCVAKDAAGNVIATSAPVYLGGEAFFTWATTAEGVQTWLTDSTTYAHVTMDYVLVAYNAYSQTVSIPLSEVIHLIAVMTDDISTTYLIELHGGTTLATMDENNQLIDARYHIAVAQVVDGVVMPLDATTTE